MASKVTSGGSTYLKKQPRLFGSLLSPTTHAGMTRLIPLPGVVGNPSRGNLSRPRHISLGYLSRLVRFARKSVTTLGN